MEYGVVLACGAKLMIALSRRRQYFHTPELHHPIGRSRTASIFLGLLLAQKAKSDMDLAYSECQPESAKDLTIIVPTLNEVGNILPLIERLEVVLKEISWSAIVVDDDSEDGTYDVARTIGTEKAHIKAVRRIGRRGLSSACIEGIAMATSPYVAVLDADLQHDEHLLRPMMELIEGGQFDLVAASRFLPGGSVGPLSWQRALMSRTANLLSAKLCRVSLSDPMSGFFMMRRTLFHEVCSRLSGHGSKILLDIVTAARRPLQCAELPLRFRERLSGESKLDAQVMWEFLYLLGQKTLKRMIWAEPDRSVARF